jgi:hypothetical protein
MEYSFLQNLSPNFMNDYCEIGMDNIEMSSYVNNLNNKIKFCDEKPVKNDLFDKFEKIDEIDFFSTTSDMQNSNFIIFKISYHTC